MKRRLRWILIAVAWIVVLALGWCAVWVYRDAAQFREMHSISKLQGLTVEEVKTRLGAPYMEASDANGQILNVVYKSRYSVYCVISFGDGRVCEVSFGGH